MNHPLRKKGADDMKITVIGRKCTPRDSFKERAEKRLKKVEKFFGDDAVKVANVLDCGSYNCSRRHLFPFSGKSG